MKKFKGKCSYCGLVRSQCIRGFLKKAAKPLCKKALQNSLDEVRPVTLCQACHLLLNDHFTVREDEAS